MKYAFALGALIVVGLLVRAGRSDVVESQNPVRVVGIYSDLSSSEQSGDIRGTEITIVASSVGFHAIVQSSEGPLGCPVLVPAVVNELTIQFTLPHDPCMYGLVPGGRFRGVVSADELRGYFEGYENFVLELPRGRSYWQ